jgi:hypothetical protein
MNSDPQTDCGTHCAPLWYSLLSLRRLAPAPALQVEPAETGAPQPRTRRSGHCPVADGRWPRLKKARREGRTIVFLDQSGFMLQPTVHRT